MQDRRVLAAETSVGPDPADGAHRQHERQGGPALGAKSLQVCWEQTYEIGLRETTSDLIQWKVLNVKDGMQHLQVPPTKAKKRQLLV